MFKFLTVSSVQMNIFPCFPKTSAWRQLSRKRSRATLLQQNGSDWPSSHFVGAAPLWSVGGFCSWQNNSLNKENWLSWHHMIDMEITLPTSQTLGFKALLLFAKAHTLPCEPLKPLWSSATLHFNISQTMFKAGWKAAWTTLQNWCLKQPSLLL